jgi:hypothetical protein
LQLERERHADLSGAEDDVQVIARGHADIVPERPGVPPR